MQKQAAEIIGTNETSLMTWERNKRILSISFIPKIIEFLGYIPSNYNKEHVTIREKILHYRQIHGLNQKKLAKTLNIDPTTLARWEMSKSQPSKKLLEKLNNLFKSCLRK